MADPVIFYDKNNQSDIYKTVAKIEFKLSEYNQSNNINKILDSLNMNNLYKEVETKNIAIKNQHVSINKKLLQSIYPLSTTIKTI